MSTWIKNGSLVDPAKGSVESLDLVIEHGRVKRLMPPGVFHEEGPRLTVIDASGKTVIPGLIDMHVHLREPGYEYKETIATGALAGVVGGYVGLACMPNTDPVNDSGPVTRFIIKRARDAGLLKVYPIGCISMGQKGGSLADFGELANAGAVGVSDDGLPVSSEELMKRAIECAREHNLTVISHCEDLSRSAGGVMHEGLVCQSLGLKGIPEDSEEVMVAREIHLARLTGCPVHIAHVSTGGSVELIRRAKEEGIPVTAETAPHYFTLDHKAVLEYNTRAKMNPPLRTERDVQSIRKGLAEGVLDAVATDHAPHSTLEKAMDFARAPFGIIGLETALPLMLSLVAEGVLTLPEAIRKLSYNPGAILKVGGGRIGVDLPADLAIIDTEYEYVFSAEDIHSMGRNSPFIGRPMKGRNLLTMIGGSVVWRRSTFHPGG